jgi:hypothetical protein
MVMPDRLSTRQICLGIDDNIISLLIQRFSLVQHGISQQVVPPELVEFLVGELSRLA